MLVLRLSKSKGMPSWLFSRASYTPDPERSGCALYHAFLWSAMSLCRSGSDLWQDRATSSQHKPPSVA